MTEPNSITDPELIAFLAQRAMGWRIYKISAHRPGSRPLPHAWQWERDGRLQLMVYNGGEGPKCNREWNPLSRADDAAELRQALAAKGVDLPDGLTDAAAVCAAAAEACQSIEPPPQEPEHVAPWFTMAAALAAKTA